MPAPLTRPVFIYDKDCGFCRRWVARWKLRTRSRIRYVPLQAPLLRLRFGVRRRDARRAAYLVEPSGQTTRGATAVFRALARIPELRAATRIARLPLLHSAARLAYWVVARNRSAAARVDRLLSGRGVSLPRDRGVRWLLLRGIGITFIVAFGSLRRQVLGLYGERGIAPARGYLEWLESELGPEEARRAAPTLLWRDASDGALVRLCDAGLASSALLALNVAPALTSATSFALWLSLVSVGQEFLSFQWDALLLESGAAAFALAPWGMLPGKGRAEPPWTARMLLRMLVFRLYFESGAAKLQSGDLAWRRCQACRYYYQTAPLPTPLGWWVHHLPPRLQDAQTAAALAIECAVPFLALGTRKMRRWAFAGFTLLQAAIAATGNYAYFNLLSLVLGLGLLDDNALPRPLRTERRARRAPTTRRWLSGAVSLPLIALGAADLLRRTRQRVPRPLRQLEQKARPFHLASTYGLFAVMTTERPEVSIEGSDDGRTWKEYVLPYKPGPTSRKLHWVAPHQPRLDWQLWFAALRGSPPVWFFQLAARLLEGSPEVLKLFAENPFPDHPPRYVRALLYDYRMTDLETRRRTGELWRREVQGLYLPPIALRSRARRGDEERPEDRV